VDESEPLILFLLDHRVGPGSILWQCKYLPDGIAVLFRSVGESFGNAQVCFPVRSAHEMQNKRRQGEDEKNVNQAARQVKNSPAAKPRNN